VELAHGVLFGSATGLAMGALPTTAGGGASLEHANRPSAQTATMLREGDRALEE
jgi:hypothetical protein